jgi:hypothetical protein
LNADGAIIPSIFDAGEGPQKKGGGLRLTCKPTVLLFPSSWGRQRSATTFGGWKSDIAFIPERVE